MQALGTGPCANEYHYKRVTKSKEQKNWVTHRKLASWLGSVSDGPFGTPKDSLNGRKNWDILVSLLGRKYYNASYDMIAKEVHFKQIEKSQTLRKLRSSAKSALNPPASASLNTIAQVSNAARAQAQTSCCKSAFGVSLNCSPGDRRSNVHVRYSNRCFKLPRTHHLGWCHTGRSINTSWLDTPH